MGRQRWSAARWILVVNPPRDRPKASRNRRTPCSDSRSLSFDAAPCDTVGRLDHLQMSIGERNREPFSAHINRCGPRRPCSMVMSPHARGVDRDHPLGVVAVAATLQPAQDPVPRAVARPGPMPPVHGLPRPVRRRQIPPRRTSPSPPQDRIHHPPVRGPRPSLTAGALHRQQRLQQRPLLIGQIMTIMHVTIPAEPAPILCQTRPSSEASVQPPPPRKTVGYCVRPARAVGLR